MTTYALHLESGPKRRKTMVHVPALLGCVALGPATDDAIAATPDVIRAYLRFLRRAGEDVDPRVPFDLVVTEHITEGEWLGNGSPYIVLSTDLVPLTDDEVAVALARFAAMRGELADWAGTLADADLDATPDGGGRTIRRVLLHVLATPGAYLAAALGGAPGFSALQTAAERGDASLTDALRRVPAMVESRVAAATPDQRVAVVQRPRDVRTLTKALRRTLEHDWEHRAELARRPGGPGI